MNIYNNYAMIIVAALFFFITSPGSEARDILPNCLFGVKSVSYILYTRSQRNGVKIQTQDDNIPLRRGRNVGFVIHGFVSQANTSSFYNLINNWLKKEDMNIFSVDWDDASCKSGLSITDVFAYGSAVKNVPVVGESVAKFTQRLAQRFGVNINQIVFIGHSLGAHISGFAGKAIQRLTHQKYKMIMGLDPAGPAFRKKSCADRLCTSDASYVLAIHTSRILGYHDAIGNADFYFHGGTKQPGCFLTTCDHSKSEIYATISIAQPNCYLGTRWKLDSSNILSTKQCNPSNCAHVGLAAAQQNVRGIFYVTPSSSSPYCSA